LLGVKRDFLGLQISNQIHGPINRQLIAYRPDYSSVTLNRLVDLDALLTHCSAFARGSQNRPLLIRQRYGSFVQFPKQATAYLKLGR
jgi:hypothetical protein